VRASLQPREGRTDIASTYLLWMISGKTFVKPSGCWYWGGPRSEDGYGVIEVQGKLHRVHRIVYEYCVADLPADAYVLHGCDNPPCCNPIHLRAGTPLDNNIDCVSRGRHATAILNEELVRQIRDFAKPGPGRLSQPRLAERFGVSLAVIQDVIYRRSWGHVE
jgi:hypothetical protein